MVDRKFVNLNLKYSMEDILNQYGENQKADLQN